jgi:hypothetical protein
MRSRGRRIGRRHDGTGRSRSGPRFTRVFHWLTETPAWRSLGAVPRALYLELAQRYNGSNNGEISMSVREAKDLVHVAKDTAMRAFRELQQKGFIRCRMSGSFNYKLRHASTWILTEHDMGDERATKDFARWRPENLETGPKGDPNCPKRGTDLFTNAKDLFVSVLDLGPPARFCTVDRSQTTARIYSAMPAPTFARILSGLVPALWLLRRPPYRSSSHRAVGIALVVFRRLLGAHR